MHLRTLTALLMFLSAYFPLALIFVIRDWDDTLGRFSNPTAVWVVPLVMLACVAVTLVAASRMRGGNVVRIQKMSNKSGDMFTYALPYMMSMNKTGLDEWQTLAGVGLFLGLMFVLTLRTQAVFVNPVLALAGYSLYDCQFKDGAREAQGLLIARLHFLPGDHCTLRRLSNFLYFVTDVPSREDHGDPRTPT